MLDRAYVPRRPRDIKHAGGSANAQALIVTVTTPREDDVEQVGASRRNSDMLTSRIPVSAQV